MHRRHALILLGALPLACTAAAPLPSAGPRIVALGSPVTETLFALGVGARLVGVDLTSQYPADTAALPKVGYFRQFSPEGVLSLAPDLVLASDESGPPLALERLRSAGITVQVLPTAADLDAARDNIRAIARVVARTPEGEALIATLDQHVDAANRVPRTSTPRVLFVYARGPGTVMVAGRDTPAAALLRLAGAINAVDAFTDFRPLTAEAVITARPDFIVIPTRGLDSLGGAPALLALPGLQQTPAGARSNIVAIDDLKLLGFGPRVGEALLELTTALHPTP